MKTLNVEETAQYLRVSRRTVFNMMKDGRLQWMKKGQSRRITMHSIQSVIDDRQERRDK